ncbi:MAG TPA: GTPase ObgE [Bacillota bacterium]|nr:GTPase ObgE [Bacillota bacterium]HPE38784.1 GTPase ObgE [Bacillota bacterium]
MFIDHAKIHIKAGDGGNGMVSFHTEKYVTNGGPDGGDGGKGGDVIMEATDELSTLHMFRFKKKFVAGDGEKGMNRKMYGRGADDLVIPVPVGTVVTDCETGKVIADFADNGQRQIIAKGGRGGQGNIHYSNSIRQAPNFARAGIPGEEFDLQVELKLIADVGLVGFPNAGKSTLLSVISGAKPKIANYPFTTIEPMLGVVAIDDFSFVVADIPGIIEGAHTGAGLGHDFLRHVERTRLLIHVVDISAEDGRDPISDFDQINEELAKFNPLLELRPQIVAANKIDQADEETIASFRAEMEKRGYDVVFMSAAIAEGTKELVQLVARKLAALPRTILTEETKEETIYTYEPKEKFTIRVENNCYNVEGNWIKVVSESTNFDDPDSLAYFQRTIRKNGVIDALEKAGIQEGDLVRMYELEFEFIR